MEDTHLPSFPPGLFVLFHVVLLSGEEVRLVGASLCMCRDMASDKRREQTKQFRQQYEVNRKIILATQEVCGICGKPVDKTLKPPHPMSATVDHIIPIAKGGHPCDLDNLQLAHRSCNRAKGDKIVKEGKREEQNPNRNLPQSRNWRST